MQQNAFNNKNKLNINKLTTNPLLRGTPSIFYSLIGCMSPLHVKKKFKKNERIKRMKPLVKVGVFGGAKLEVGP